MVVYHLVNSDAVDVIHKQGLKRTSRGDKGDDSAIIKTDKFLDRRRPKIIRDAGISRDNNLYGYLCDGDKIIDIQNGKLITPSELNRQNDQAVLRLEINPERCYVSDIDAYDRVKSAIEDDRPSHELQSLADEYWGSIKSLGEYSSQTVRRPEVMITCDIEPEFISVVTI